MKRTLFLVAASFVIGATVQASEHVSSAVENSKPITRNYVQPVIFVEQGIEFLIYPGISIAYTHNGQVNRIGDIPVKYKKGALDKVGNLKMHYDRSGRIYKQTGSIYKEQNTKSATPQINTGYGDRSRRS